VALKGIDISNWQGRVSWAAVAADGVQFAIAKASESTTYADPWFARNWFCMKAAGIARGAYHFAQPDHNGPEAEADYFMARIADAGGLLPGDVLALDMEAGSGNLLSWTTRCLARLGALCGFRPLLYSGAWFMEPHGLYGDPELSQHGLWLAHYSATPPAPPPNWPVLAIWQYTDELPVAGIAGGVDGNWGAFDTVDQFQLYGLPGG
jgi:lysozyme